MTNEFQIRGRRIALPDGLQPASLHIKNGAIAEIGAYESSSSDAPIVEVVDSLVVMPGLVDTHVHVNEPGRTHWEGFWTATRAAAAGGVTTIVDMPLNSIPATTNSEALREKITAAHDKCFVDTAFWGGVVPGNTSELSDLVTCGVVGFKCFLVPSGVDEFPHVTESNLREALPELKRLDAVLIVHAEVPEPIEASLKLAYGSPAQYQTFLASRPRAAENEAIELMIRLAREFDARIHIVHHSSADALPVLRDAISSGVKITAETCPHYLTFAAEEIAQGATEFKCCPPIRERHNRDQLWQALADNTIQMVVSDHSPCPPDMKLQQSGDFLAAWGGISSLQIRLPIVWTEARKRNYRLDRLMNWLCFEPAKLVGLEKRKGRIQVGYDADLVVWSPEQKFVVKAEELQHRHKLSPYEGRELSGVVASTYLRGQKIYDDGALSDTPIGRLLLSNE